LNLPTAIQDAWMGEVAIVYIGQTSGGSLKNEFDNKPIARVAEGIELWSKPVALHVLRLDGKASNDSKKWKEWAVTEDVMNGVLNGLPPLKEKGSEGQFLVLSQTGSICSISPGTKEGGIEAFHKSMRLMMDKNEPEE